jgi:hypothetical protein
MRNKMSIKELKKYLSAQKEGPVSDVDTLELLLAACWHTIEGGRQAGMNGHKLLGRLEKAEWCPPVLEFTIERHGGTVLGSTRAELQRWCVDVEAQTADWSPAGRRQLRPMQKRLDVRPLADELAQLISLHTPDPRLRWAQDGTVTVRMGKVLPYGSAVQQTLVGRRKRLRSQLEQKLAERGWRMVRERVRTAGSENPLTHGQGKGGSVNQ